MSCVHFSQIARSHLMVHCDKKRLPKERYKYEYGQLDKDGRDPKMLLVFLLILYNISFLFKI